MDKIRPGFPSLPQEIADIFAEDSENDQTFYGFSDGEINALDDAECSDSDGSYTKSITPRRTPRRFTIRLALRPRPTFPSSGEEEVEEGGEAETEHFKSQVERKPKSPQSGSDSETDRHQTFLEKRALNIKANKAMLAQLMADLQKMPEALKTAQAGRQKGSQNRAPARASTAAGGSRRNPERVSRRTTRSMGGCESSTDDQLEKKLELSLEEELMEVRHTRQRRGAPRPNQAKPHIVRPVEDIGQDELSLVADGVTDKVYNSATGSTCHQCRQKTTDTKTCCRNEDCRGIQGQFCGPCLRNRYGEEARNALLDPVRSVTSGPFSGLALKPFPPEHLDWRCPPCRGICNCSFCRQRDGRCPTGILLPLAQYHGFSDVHSYLSSLRNNMKTGEDS